MSTRVPAVSNPIPVPGQPSGATTFFPGHPYANEATPTVYDDAISLWLLNEESGTRYDSIGSNHLTDNNTVMAADKGVGAPANLPGRVASFVAGSSEYLSLASLDWSSFATSGFSMSFWYNAAGDEYWLVSRDNVATRSFAAGRQSNTIRWATFDGVNDFTGTADGGDNTWNHCLLTWDPADSKPRIYVNDTVTVGGAAAFPFVNPPFELGGKAATGNYITGLMSTVSVWPRVLTSDERTALYNGGDGAVLP